MLIHHFDVRYSQAATGGVRGSWVVRESGEWGLRFWSVVCLQFDNEPASAWQYDIDTGVLSGQLNGCWVVLKGEKAPLLMTFHDDLDALREEFETHGYWYLDLRDAVGSLAVARYNFEEMPEFRFAIGTGETQAQALEQATDALSITDEPPIGSLHVGRFEGALDVVRDVVGWNTVYDAINDRPYTALSRNWSSLKFGGFGVWLDDVLYHGVLANVLERQIVMDNLRAALACATEAGNLACLLTGCDAWIDRSQPPLRRMCCG